MQARFSQGFYFRPKKRNSSLANSKSQYIFNRVFIGTVLHILHDMKVSSVNVYNTRYIVNRHFPQNFQATSLIIAIPSNIHSMLLGKVR